MVERSIQEQIVREAPEVEAYKLGLLEAGKKIADQPIDFTQHGAQRQVAGPDVLETGAYDYLRGVGAGGIGGYAPFAATGRGTMATGLGTLGSAQGVLQQAQGAMGLGTGQYGGGPGYAAAGFDPASATQYMNPYEDAVVQQAMADIQRQGDIARTQADAQAVGAGAFGGSRQGIQRAEMGRNLLDAQARTAAGLRSAGYQSAMGQAQQAFADQQRRAQAEAQFRTGIGQSSFEAAKQRQMGLGSGIASIGGQLAGLGVQQAGIGGQQLAASQMAQQSRLRDLMTQQQFGQQQRGIEQARLDAATQNAQRQLYEPYGRVSWLGDIYKGAPSSQSVLGSMQAPSPQSPSMFQQIAGLGTGLLGTAVAAKQVGGLFG